MHDHKFDFSQPEIACRECHDEGDERLGKKPTHAFNIRPVAFAAPLTLEQNCLRCHADKTAEWMDEGLKKIRKRL